MLVLMALVEDKMVLSAIETTLKTYEDKSLLKLLEATGNPIFKHFCVDVIDLIQSRAASDESKALVSFHQLSINAFPSLWEALCKELSLSVFGALTSQSVNRQLLKEVLQESSDSLGSQRPSSKHQATMLGEEENAVRYASWYVAMKVMKLFEKEDSVKAFSIH